MICFENLFFLSGKWGFLRSRRFQGDDLSFLCLALAAGTVEDLRLEQVTNALTEIERVNQSVVTDFNVYIEGLAVEGLACDIYLDSSVSIMIGDTAALKDDLSRKVTIADPGCGYLQGKRRALYRAVAEADLVVENEIEAFRALPVEGSGYPVVVEQRAAAVAEFTVIIPADDLGYGGNVPGEDVFYIKIADIVYHLIAYVG